MSEIYLALVLVFFLVAVFFFVILRQKSLQNKEYILELKQKQSELEVLKIDQNKLYVENLSLKNSLHEKKLELESLEKKFNQEKASLKQDYQNDLAEFKKEFNLNRKEQNSAFLDQNKLFLNEEGKKLLSEIFEPIKKSVKEYNEKLAHNETRLQENIKNMFEYSQNIGQKAEHLAKILKGDKKVRGNFAELQLKNVLENSGLKEGEQYRLQEYFKEEGKAYYPDAVVYLDKQKSIVIDAKFSLPSDFDFTNDDESLCKDLANNLKARIDELSKKPYAHFEAHTYDYVLLFIPYQNILDLALQNSPNLYQEAYKKGIYLTTPQTLFMALNTINIAWRHIKSNENILKAFEELGKMYDKFAGFLEDFEGLKRAYESLGKKLVSSETKLIRGSGNLALRLERLKDLGAKTNKAIKTEFDTHLSIEEEK